MFIRPVEVRALESYGIRVRYEDGVEGEVDLSDLAGRGVFAAFEDREFFEMVHLGEFGQVRWNEDVELDPYALYLRLTGKSAEELFPNLGEARTSEASGA